MTLLEAMAIVVGIGFALALISSVKAWNLNRGSKLRLVDLAIPFALRWGLYSGGVALALGMQFLLQNLGA